MIRNTKNNNLMRKNNKNKFLIQEGKSFKKIQFSKGAKF
jgi:hypothetical protein